MIRQLGKDNYEYCMIDLGDPYDTLYDRYSGRKCTNSATLELRTVCCVCKQEVVRWLCNECNSHFFCSLELHKNMSCANPGCLSILETCPVV
jgi:hypothetical protein